MSYYQDGNLARKVAVPYAVPKVRTTPPDVKEAQKKARREQLQKEADIRSQYKAVGRTHARTVLRLVCLFMVLATAVGFIVLRNARITEMSFVNAGLKRQIGELDKQNGLIEDRVAAKASFQVTRDQAAEELGMQKASADQIRYISAAQLRLPASGELDTEALLSDLECARTIENWVRDN